MKSFEGTKERIRVETEKLKIVSTVIVLLTGGLTSLLFKNAEPIVKIFNYVFLILAVNAFYNFLRGQDMEHYNKKEKTANWLFKIAEYVAIALGINALLPNNPLTMKNILIGAVVLLFILTVALWITPEKEERQ